MLGKAVKETPIQLGENLARQCELNAQLDLDNAKHKMQTLEAFEAVYPKLNISAIAKVGQYRGYLDIYGITQEELADFLGVTKASISKWENAQSTPDLMLLLQLSAFF